MPVVRERCEALRAAYLAKIGENLELGVEPCGGHADLVDSAVFGVPHVLFQQRSASLVCYCKTAAAIRSYEAERTQLTGDFLWNRWRIPFRIGSCLNLAQPVEILWYWRRLARYGFLPGTGAAIPARVTTADDAGETGFFGCLGFFGSRLLRCSPLGIRVLLRGCASGGSCAASDWYVAPSFSCRGVQGIFVARRAGIPEAVPAMPFSGSGAGSRCPRVSRLS